MFWLGVIVGICIIGVMVIPVFAWCLSKAYELGYMDKEREDSKWLKIFREE